MFQEDRKDHVELYFFPFGPLTGGQQMCDQRWRAINHIYSYHRVDYRVNAPLSSDCQDKRGRRVAEGVVESKFHSWL